MLLIKRILSWTFVACNHLRRGGYVFVGVSLFACLLAGSRKNYSTNFCKIPWKGGRWATENR